MWLSSRVASPKQGAISRSARCLNRDARRLFLEPLEERLPLTFDVAVDYPAGTNPQAVVAGHFNSDLILDLAVANYGSSNVSVLLGNADGSFAPAGDFATGANPRSVAVGDFDGDGMLDVATANHGGTDLSVLLGNGDGSLNAPLSVPLPTPPPTVVDPPLAVAVGDIDGDGKLDLVATSQDSYSYYTGGGCWYYCYGGGWYSVNRGYVHVILGNGNATFASPISYQLSSGSPMAVAVEDFDSDGNLDVVTANQEGGSVSVLMGNGDGTLRYAWWTNDYAASWYTTAVTVGDFTGDGILDIAAAGQTVDILPGLGNGTFQPVQRQYIDPVTVAAADFNGDGKLDVVTAEPSAGTVSVLLGTGTGMLSLAIDHSAGASPSAVVTGDFNGDGRPDVAAANAGSGDVSVLLNDGTWPALSAPSLRITDVSVTEGHEGTVTATLNVTLSAAANQDVTVHFATVDSWSAAAGSDYVARSGQVTIPAGQTTAPIDISVLGDRVMEFNESFAVRLTDPVGAFIADGLGVATITDDEPRISIDSFVSAAEGNTGTTAIDFKVRLSVASDQEVRVNFSTAEGDTESWYWGYYYSYESASAGIDYVHDSDTLIFAPGEIEKTISILANGDRAGESNELFSVNLSDPVGAGIVSGHGVGLIIDDEPWAYFSSSPTVVEGSAGTTEAKFTVTLSAPAEEPISVEYSTADYYYTSAAAGADYEAALAQTVNFGPGDTTQTITVLVHGDRVAEYTEYFAVRLTSAVGANLGYYPPEAVATIVDDDAHLSISDVRLSEGNSGVTMFNFVVSLSSASDGEVTVRYDTSNGSAQSGSDYQSQSGTLIFAAGELSKTISIAVTGDISQEGEEYFYIQLSQLTGNAMLDDAWGYGTIVNDDADSGGGGKGFGKGGKRK